MRAFQRPLFLIPALCLLAASLSAQAVLRPGTTTRGELKAGDLRLDDDTYADLWRFNGSTGQSVGITMRSSDFDTYLVVGYFDQSGNFKILESDDDGGGGTDSRVAVRLPSDGEYVARANTLRKGETGTYTLDLELGAGPQASAPQRSQPGSGDSLVSVRPGARMPLVLGQTLRGTLEDGDDKLSDDSPADIWVYFGRKGETLTMVQRSTAHNAYLTAGPVSNGRWVWTDSNDNDAGGTDAKLVVTLKADGEYWVRPNAHNKGTGPYTLVVTSDRNPSAAGPTLAAPASAGQAQPAMPSAGPLQQGLAPGVSNAPNAAAPAQPSPAPRVANRTPIQFGQTVRGELSASDEFNFDSTYVDTYVFQGKRGQQVTILMMSPSFGSYVLFGKPAAPGATFSSIETKGAVRGAEARLVVAIPEDGDYWIRANSFEKTTGSYVLTLEAAR